MNLKLRTLVFIDRLTFEVNEPQACTLRAVLKNDQGSVCSALETEVTQERQIVDLEGLSELPYGEYTLVVSQGDDELKMRLVKRI
jgi:hypothetical protein